MHQQQDTCVENVVPGEKYASFYYYKEVNDMVSMLLKSHWEDSTHMHKNPKC